VSPVGLRLRRPGGRTLLVAPGPRLLAHLGSGPGLAAHTALHGPRPAPLLDDLLGALRPVDVRGRGGAGFPLARKVETAAASSGRPTVVVNLSEGEPASAKDAALALAAPHTVLDGAAAVAHALRSREVHLVLPREAPDVVAAVRLALHERRGEGRDGRLRWTEHLAAPRFVAGQAWAVLELLAGRENLPVTAWQPESRRGYKARPTLLSNAETFAQVAAVLRLGVASYASVGTVEEPGTCLLTVDGDSREPRVVEVAHGTPWSEVLGPRVQDPVLLGGYHGTWVGPGALAGLTVSRGGLAQHGLALGAGVVLPETGCPVEVTASVTAYLASESAGRCGPCVNGLPALAATMARVAAGDAAAVDRARELAGLVTRRGACAHPDGTARLVRSLLDAYDEEVAAHASGGCTFGTDRRAAG
jgi:NADH:ubiquinone oxidoreductase subunit F (NADH-binding)